MKAFSLSELVATIAIIAILTAVSVPAYSSYRIRTNIVKAVRIASSISNDIMSEYEKTGAFPNSINVNGVNLISPPGGNWEYVNLDNIISMIYAISPDGLGATIGLTLSGLYGIPEYSPPQIGTGSPGPGGVSQFQFAIRNFNGLMKTACGGYGPPYEFVNIPLDYLPSACQCNNIQNFYMDGIDC